MPINKTTVCDNYKYASNWFHLGIHTNWGMIVDAFENQPRNSLKISFYVRENSKLFSYSISFFRNTSRINFYVYSSAEAIFQGRAFKFEI